MIDNYLTRPTGVPSPAETDKTQSGADEGVCHPQNLNVKISNILHRITDKFKTKNKKVPSK